MQVTDGVHLVMVGAVITVGVTHVMAMAMVGATAGAGAGDIQVMDIILLITHHIILVIMREPHMANVMHRTLAE